MVAYTYSRVAALNFNTTPPGVAKSATGSVYAVADTTFTTPLNMTMVVGGAVVTTISSDAQGFFPDFTVADRTSVVWKQASSSFTTVLTTSDPVPGPQGAAGTPGSQGVKGDRGDLATWLTNTFYPLNMVIANPSGDLVKVITAHTSGASYDATKFDYANNNAVDNINATKIADTGSATRGALNTAITTQTLGKLDKTEAATTYAPAFVRSRSVLGPRTVFDGDSVTIGNITTTVGLQNRASGWTQVMARAADGKIEELFNAGLSGQTSAGTLSRFDAFVAPHAPQTVILTIGTNDVGQSLTLASWQANIIAYWEKCKAINARLVVGEIWPTDSTNPAGRGATVRTWNVWLHEWARTNDIPVIPWTQLADVTTGGWPAAWTTDQIHPKVQDIATTTIGLFGWNAIKDFYGQPTIKRPTMNNGDLLTNGFMTLTSTALGTPVPTNTVSTASGTLPAGTYSYKVTTRSRSGETVASAETVGVLGADGTITVNWTNISSNAGYRVYRKAPAESNWFLIQTLGSSVITFADNGSFTPGATTAPTVGESIRPTGLTEGQTKYQLAGFAPRTVAGIRGNVWRFTPYDDATESSNYFTTGTINAGDVIEVSGRVAGSGGSSLGKVIFYFRDASTNLATVILVTDVLTTEFGTFHHRLTAPAGTINARFYFQVPAGGWMDVAELRVEKVN